MERRKVETVIEGENTLGSEMVKENLQRPRTRTKKGKDKIKGRHRRQRQKMRGQGPDG